MMKGLIHKGPESSPKESKSTILQKKEIEKMNQMEADEYAARDFHRLITTMYPEDFIFLLEKISIDALKNIFGNLSETEISLMNDKVENDATLKNRLEALTNKIKPKDKYITQEIITPEYEQMIVVGTELIENIKKEHGYGVTSLVLKQNRLYVENKKITKKELEEIRETIVDLKTLLTIIEEVKDLIKSGATFSGGVDIKNFSFSAGGFDITLIKSPENAWGIEKAYEVMLVTEKFREYLQNKSTNRSKKVKT